jgi:RNA polymerase sigma factor (sigma-70 family)
MGVGEIDGPELPNGGRLTDAERDVLVVDVIRLHADGLLRIARRHSLGTEDAQDAYQRGLEIFLRHAHRLDPDGAASWLRTVVKHEAMAVRRVRQRELAPPDLDFERLEARTTPSPDEQIVAFEAVAQSAEALRRLKPQEVRALWLQAQGNSYDEIRELTGWTRTKVNRCLYEGRRSFLERVAGIQSGAECERWEPLLSALVDGEASTAELVDLRPHLRACTSCRAVVRELHRAAEPLRVVLPAGAFVAAAPHADPASHLFVKVYDTATTWLGERAASSFVRAQIAVDAASASVGKVTAIAAASAAVAGGGAVALDQVSTGTGKAPAAAAAPLGRAAEPIDAGGSQRALTIDEQVQRRVATLRRRLARHAAAAASSAAAHPATHAPTVVPAAARSAGPSRAVPAATAPSPSPSPGAAAELGLE